MILIGGKTYQLVHEHKNGWNPEVFRERYSEVLDRYDFIIGDWGYNQLRLKGFFRDNHPKATRDSTFSSIMEYVNEYCNFGCAYFVLEKIPTLPGQIDPGVGNPDGLEPEIDLGDETGDSRADERQPVVSEERKEPFRREHRSHGDRHRRKETAPAASASNKETPAGGSGKDRPAKGANPGRKHNPQHSERKKDGNTGSHRRFNPASGERKEQVLSSNRKETAASSERPDSGRGHVSQGGRRNMSPGERRQQPGGDKAASQDGVSKQRTSSRQE